MDIVQMCGMAALITLVAVLVVAALGGAALYITWIIILIKKIKKRWW